MKKLYATLFVAALGAGTMCAQTLSTIWTKHYDMEVGEYDPEAPEWSMAGSIKTQPGMMNATGIAGKLYGIDMKTMSVVEFDENGSRKAFDLPSLAGQTVSHTELSAAGALVTSPDFYGSLITRDDAGNILVGHAQGTGAACTTWTVLDRNTGNTKRLVADITNHQSCLPINMIGRAVGDVTKEGYLYVGPTSIFWPVIKDFSWVSGNHLNIQLTKILSFTGDGTVAGTNVKGEVSGPAPLANWYLTTCSPWYSTVEDMKAAPGINQTFFLYSKLQGQGALTNIYGAMVGILNPDKDYDLNSPFQVTSCDMTGINSNLYLGFDTFELNGKRYYVASYNDDDAFNNEGLVQFGVFDETGYLPLEGDCLWAYDGEWSDEGVADATAPAHRFPAGNMTINIEKVDNDNVNIYVWAEAPGCGVFAGMFNYGNGNIGTGITDVAVDANNESPVYYNLNGVRVENPRGGIFIEKRGSKAIKVVK